MATGFVLSGAALATPTSARTKAAPAPASAPAPVAVPATVIADDDPGLSANSPPSSAPGSSASAPGTNTALQLDAASPDDDAANEDSLDPYTRIHDLEVRLEQTRSVIAGQKPRVSLTGYIDGGFFVPQGNGAGIVRDNGNTLFPQYAGKYGWVFLGDILSTAVNSRGEVADLGNATGAPPRFDSVHSGGAPGFIANEVNLTLNSGVGQSALAGAQASFSPEYEEAQANANKIGLPYGS
jgi:hypothetical protein